MRRLGIYFRHLALTGCLAAACTACGPDGGRHSTSGTGAREINPVIATIHSRKSVRQYTGRRVSEEQVEILLRAGMAAPTGRDLRPWEFVVLRDRALLDSLAAGLPYGKMLAQASVAIAVCGDTLISARLWVEDCAMASQNILLAAESLGLGAVFTAVYPYPERLALVEHSLRLPVSVVPLCIIPVGYPQGVQTPKRKFDPAKIHYETYTE